MLSSAARQIIISGRPRYDSAAAALFARMTTQPTQSRKALINNTIIALKTGGVWSLCDALYVTAAADSQAARLNWIADQYNLTAFNSPVFTVDRGYTGDGSAAYLDTGAVASSLAKYALNSANAWGWQLNNATDNGHLVDTTTASQFVIARTTGNKSYVRINDGGLSTATINPTITDSRGLTSVNRSGANSRELYKNGASVGSDTQVSTAASGTFHLLGISGGYSTAQIAAAGFGSTLTAAQELAKYNALRAYMTGVGIP